MSPITSTALRSLRTCGGGAMASRRTFVTVTRRLNLKESTSQTDVDYDRHKKDSLAKQKRGAGHWKPELASDSEEAVRADRASREGPGEDVRRLQERTKRAAEETAQGGTSMRDGM